MDVPTEEAPQDLTWILLGPRFAGFMAQVCLYGFCLSTYLHTAASETFSKETRRLKWLMAAVTSLNTAATGIVIREVLLYGVTQDRTVENLGDYTVTDALWPVPAGLVSFLVQIYLARRTYLFTPAGRARIAIVGAIAICVLFAIATWVVIVVLGFMYLRGTAPSLSLYNAMLASTMFGAAAADVIISVALAVQLGKRFQGFNERTDSILWKLIRIALLSGAYTSVFATVAAVLSPALQNSLYQHVQDPFVVTLPSMYTLALFTTTRTRRELRKTAHKSFIGSPPPPNPLKTPSPNSAARLGGVDVSGTRHYLSPPPTEDSSTNASSGGPGRDRPMHIAVTLGSVRSELERQKLDDIELQRVESRGPTGSDRV